MSQVVVEVLVVVVTGEGTKIVPLVLTRNVLLSILNTLQVGDGIAVFSGGAVKCAEG